MAGLALRRSGPSTRPAISAAGGLFRFLPSTREFFQPGGMNVLFSELRWVWLP